MKVAVVYWSGTGNTAAMADAVAEGAKGAGADVNECMCMDFDQGSVASYDALIFGCPAMGSEVLEEDDFGPMFEAVLPKLAGKKVALFGSYGWGGGEWMANWEAQCKGKGVALAADSVICENAPDDEALDKCRALGAKLAG
jgi:flavodoxin short chain